MEQNFGPFLYFFCFLVFVFLLSSLFSLPSLLIFILSSSLSSSYFAVRQTKLREKGQKLQESERERERERESKEKKVRIKEQQLTSWEKFSFVSSKFSSSSPLALFHPPPLPLLVVSELEIQVTKAITRISETIQMMPEVLGVRGKICWVTVSSGRRDKEQNMRMKKSRKKKKRRKEKKRKGQG